jgi:hypothetical protein
MTTTRSFVVLLVVSSTAFADAPVKAVGGAHRAALVVNFDCASSAQFPASALGSVVRSALAGLGDTAVATWGDRAVAQDLNGDGLAEYLVPLICGATGNCTWGVFGTRPVQQLGTVSGARIQVSFSGVGWAKLLTYSSLGAGQGSSQVFAMRGHRYIELERHEVAGPDNDRLLGSMGEPKCESK